MKFIFTLLKVFRFRSPKSEKFHQEKKQDNKEIAEIQVKNSKEAQDEQLAAIEKISVITSEKNEEQIQAVEYHQESTKSQQEEVSSEVILRLGEYIQPSSYWFAQYEAVAGISHRKATAPLPCQDSAVAFVSPKPTVIIADGAGSSAVSDLGSKAVVTGLARFIKTMERYFSELLDQESSEAKQHDAALILVKHAKGILEDLETEHRRPLKDFRCTLLLAIIGKVHTLWVKVGDGALVIEKKEKTLDGVISKLSTLGEVGKGEYANATTFIGEHLQPNDVQSGVVESKYITALFAMSDGSAEKFVSNKGDKVAQRLSSWADLLRQERLFRYQLTKAFYAEDFLQRHTGDDCCIAMVSAKLS
ncbi:protein phosphatase 2C domain-containing protein [Seminibacterium arietis]|uniref:Protein phosphatase 2C domain-containing protein n=1 Tax=Seminibacterium arietis TaxID=1173502 RepID=A0ABW3I9Y6_9PAST